jgi:hypothetical protein
VFRPSGRKAAAGFAVALALSAASPAVAADAGGKRYLVYLHGRIVVLHTGLGHGFLYEPLPEWMQPTLEWAGGASSERPPAKKASSSP